VCNGTPSSPAPDCPYPLESVGLRNPTVPNRVEPFRDFASVFHDESAAAQAFPGFYVTDPVFRYILAGVKDAFMINYGSGGIGSEIIANRLGVGPMHDCLTCAFEEFFLTSFTVGDPAMLTDVAANLGLEALLPGQAPPPGTQGPKANFVVYPDDVANVHHSYTGDFTKIRNTHNGKEQHVFHLHNHQWLFNANDDNSNYLDAQGIGPGVGYTYEINFGGSGNRMKSAGDSIFHCHFYPHFAQGMWYHWRHHDVFESGTPLAVSQAPDNTIGFHTVPFALENGTPAVDPSGPVTNVAGIDYPARVRSIPDGEVVVGAPIAALVPLPGKAMAPLPGKVQLVPNPLVAAAGLGNAAGTGVIVPVGSLAKVVDRDINPGYPFWIAGIEDTVGQRPPSPPLDMVSAGLATTLAGAGINVPVKTADNTVLTTITDLFGNLAPSQADGFDGGLPRAALQGYAAGGVDNVNIVSRLDFTKTIGEAQAVFYPEEGTDVEQVAMAYHAVRNHPSYAVDMAGSVTSAFFVTNGNKPVVGAPFHEPCIDDDGDRIVGDPAGNDDDFFSDDENVEGGKAFHGSSIFTADNPRIYKGVNIQYDAVLNKVGYHYPQQRIIALWQDAVPIITKQKPGEPFVLRNNTFDCTIYHHSNLVPEVYELDDYQVRTPTDIIGQHIHLPKWDLTTADGAANGWNYEDGTLSPGAVRERIEAANHFVTIGGGTHRVGSGSGTFSVPAAFAAGTAVPQPHPFFNTVAPAALAPLWVGARTTTQRWFFDPVVNTDGEDRGLGIIFTHDHYGPSTHQQIGLYATVLTEPAGSTWRHNETGVQLGQDPVTGLQQPGRIDGGPTSWQAAILPPTGEPFREFYFEYTDFQHAYEAGVYVGTGHLGEPLPGAGPVGDNAALMAVLNAGNPLFGGNPADAFRFAINPPGRGQVAPVFPDLVLELKDTLIDPLNNFCPVRPCPTAIDVQDPGMFSVNYLNEPVGLRVYDPNRIGPDGNPGAQATGLKGDLAFALQSRTDRAIPALNVQPVAGSNINGTVFPPPINAAGVDPGDPYTPMVRSFAGDLVRIKQQAGGDEEEHNSTIHGMKWLQSGSGHGRAPNSGWRAAQAGGISEQFTLTTPVLPFSGNTRQPFIDYAYSMDASQDGWWSGMWGIFRAYEQDRSDLYKLPTSVVPLQLANGNQFNGVCPVGAPVRNFDISAVLANNVLPPNAAVTIRDICPGPDCVGTGHEGVAPSSTGGTLVYNSRTTLLPAQPCLDANHQVIPGCFIGVDVSGPIHDPTAMLFVRTDDLEPINPAAPLCTVGGLGVRNPLCPARLKATVPVEPLVLRARAGDCIQVTLRNRLPAASRSLPTLGSLLGVVKRNRFFNNGVEQGSTTFQTNLIKPSSFAGLHPQLITYDTSRDDGTVIGQNTSGVLNPYSGVTPPLLTEQVRWYAGDLKATRDGNTYTLTATPVEFGTSNIQAADQIYQGMKGLVGQLVIEPVNSTWTEDADDPARPNTRMAATVAGPSGTFRDFSLVITKGNTQYYADSSPVEHLNGEGIGIPEDPQESSGMAMNYGIEPAWFRFGIRPNAAFGNNNTPASFGFQTQFDLYSNNRLQPPVTAGGTSPGPFGDPETPVFMADAGLPFRMRLGVPHGTNRGTTFQLHGHGWQRDPYICVDAAGLPTSKDGLLGRCATTELGSTGIGHNPLAKYMGAQESINAPTHFDIVVASAGGGNAVLGDYLFRDTASFGNASGLWGIVRVAAAGPPPPVTGVTLNATPSGPIAPSAGPVTWTATPSGGASPEYRFYMWNGSAYVVVQDYGDPAGASYSWDTSALSPGTYHFIVYARSAGSTAEVEAWASSSYVLATAIPPVGSVGLSAAPVGPIAPSAGPVLWTATPSGGTSPEYRFYMWNGSSYVVVQDYGDPAGANYNWDTSALSPGTYYFIVYARSAGSTAEVEAWAFSSYVLQ